MKITCGYGDSGVLILPWLDFAVPLYSENTQATVDRENCALIQRRYKRGHADVICDHASQGFDIIKKCGYTYPAVVQTPRTSKIYRWEATMLGRNRKGLWACSGARLEKIKWADLIMYTCNDEIGENISIVFWKLQEEVKYPMYDVNAEK